MLMSRFIITWGHSIMSTIYAQHLLWRLMNVYYLVYNMRGVLEYALPRSNATHIFGVEESPLVQLPIFPGGWMRFQLVVCRPSLSSLTRHELIVSAQIYLTSEYRFQPYFASRNNVVDHHLKGSLVNVYPEQWNFQHPSPFREQVSRPTNQANEPGHS